MTRRLELGRKLVVRELNMQMKFKAGNQRAMAPEVGMTDHSRLHPSLFDLDLGSIGNLFIERLPKFQKRARELILWMSMIRPKKKKTMQNGNVGTSTSSDSQKFYVESMLSQKTASI